MKVQSFYKYSVENELDHSMCCSIFMYLFFFFFIYLDDSSSDDQINWNPRKSHVVDRDLESMRDLTKPKEPEKKKIRRSAWEDSDSDSDGSLPKNAPRNNRMTLGVGMGNGYQPPKKRLTVTLQTGHPDVLPGVNLSSNIQGLGFVPR